MNVLGIIVNIMNPLIFCLTSGMILNYMGVTEFWSYIFMLFSFACFTPLMYSRIMEDLKW